MEGKLKEKDQEIEWLRGEVERCAQTEQKKDDALRLGAEEKEWLRSQTGILSRMGQEKDTKLQGLEKRLGELKEVVVQREEERDAMERRVHEASG